MPRCSEEPYPDLVFGAGEDQSKVRLGVYFRDESRPRYEETRHLPTLTADEKLETLEKEFDRYAV